MGPVECDYYELLKPGETIEAKLCQLQVMRMGHGLRAKRAERTERYDKVLSPAWLYFQKLPGGQTSHLPDFRPPTYRIFQTFYFPTTGFFE